MKFDTDNWRNFFIADLFDVSLSKGDIQGDNYSKGNIPLISSGELYNGVVDYISEDADGVSEIFESNKITVDMFCNAFYQARPFFAVSHGRVNILTPLFNMNRYTGIFITTLINKEAYKYSYGRAVYSGVLKKMLIKLPVTPELTPDWNFIEDYIKTLKYTPLVTNNSSNTAHNLFDETTWKDFILKDIFTIVKGKRLTKADMISGNVNFIGAISVNNGIREHIKIDEYLPGNCISVNYNGSVGEAFYQSEPFWASDDVNILYSKDWEMNKYIGLFLASIIKLERYKYSYGRKWILKKMEESKIKLPTNNCGNPDWKFMENYIKSLPNGDLI